MMPLLRPLGRNLATGFLSIERTEVIETALARRWPLDRMCPHPACELTGAVCLAVTADPPYMSETVVFEFHPCGHRYWPQWRVPELAPSRFLDHPVGASRTPWWRAITGRKRP